jgi:hypothetical protein
MYPLGKRSFVPSVKTEVVEMKVITCMIVPGVTGIIGINARSYVTNRGIGMETEVSGPSSTRVGD